jgi:hypothetical protein
MSNLRLLNNTTITSGVSTVKIEDVFSSDFNVYKIVSNGISTVGTTQTDPNFRFINSTGNVVLGQVSGGGYNYAHKIMRSDSGFTQQRETDENQFYRFFGESTDQAPETQSSIAYIFNPYSHAYTLVYYQSMASSAALNLSMAGIGALRLRAKMTGFQLIDANGSRPFSGGNIKTYGLRVD